MGESKIASIAPRIFILLLRAYQIALSPLLGYHCRFFPSCSQYMLEAIKKYGVGRGVWLGLKRLVRCHPGCQGGIDPVPEPPLTKLTENKRHD